MTAYLVENIRYLNFFDDRLHNLYQDGLDLVAEAYYALYPEKKNIEKIYCFLDCSVSGCDAMA